MFAHDRVDQLVVDVHLVIGQQGGAYAAAPVGTAGALVDLGDGVGHDEPPDLAVGYRPSISAWRFRRNRVASQIPVSTATAATDSPERSRTMICRRTEAGYIRGM